MADGLSLPRAPMPAPPDRQFSFTDWQVNNPSAPPPGDRLDAEFDRTNASISDIIDWASVSLNTDGSLRDASVGESQLVPGLFDDVSNGIIADVQPLVDEAKAAANASQASAGSAATSAASAASHNTAAQSAATSAQGSAASAGSAASTAQDNATIADDAATTAGNAANDAEFYGGLATDYGLVCQAWAEHMPDTIPPNILAVMGITGQHWSARWWATQAANIGNGGGASLSDDDPAMDGVAHPGIGIQASRWDHVHPSDASRLALAGGQMQGALLLLPPYDLEDEAVSKQYVDDAIAAFSAYMGTWLVASNVPDISAGGTRNSENYIAITADPAAPETAPPGIPGIGGKAIHNGDRIIWSADLHVWQVLREGNLTLQLADARYLQLTGGIMQGPLVLNADATGPMEPATLRQLETYLPLAGGALTGALTLAADATRPLEAVTLQQLTATGMGTAYLPLTGGTLSGTLISNVIGDWTSYSYGKNIVLQATNGQPALIWATNIPTNETWAWLLYGETFYLCGEPSLDATTGTETIFLTFDHGSPGSIRAYQPMFSWRDPQTSTEVANKRYVDAVNARLTNYLPLAGGTMEGPLVLLPPFDVPDEAVSKQYVDDAIGALGLYAGTWQVALNSPDISTGGTLDNENYIAVTANPDVAELAPANVPGIGGQVIFNGDRVLWASGLGIWQVVREGNLTLQIGDARYLQLTGGIMSGSLVLAANAAQPMEPVALQQLNASLAGFLPLGGGTLTGPLILRGNATAPNEAVTLNQLNGLGSQLNNYLPLSGGTLSGGLSFGSRIATSPTDLSQHLELFDGGWGGINVTSGKMNFVANKSVVFTIGNTFTADFVNSPTMPTPVAADNSLKGATTAFVTRAVNGFLPLTGGQMQGQLLLLPPYTVDDQAISKQYVDDAIASMGLYEGTWRVALNVPSITAGGSRNSENYLAITADPNIPETAPAGIPGIGGAIIHNGDRIIWAADAIPPQWQVLREGNLTLAIADARYLQLTGGKLSGPLVLAGYAAGPYEAVPLQQLNSSLNNLPYLPLTGGTLSGDLVVNAQIIADWATINNNLNVKATLFAAGIICSGGASIGSNGIAYSGGPANHNAISFGWGNGRINASVDGTGTPGELANLSDLTGQFLPLTGGTLSGLLTADGGISAKGPFTLNANIDFTGGGWINWGADPNGFAMFYDGTVGAETLNWWSQATDRPNFPMVLHLKTGDLGVTGQVYAGGNLLTGGQLGVGGDYSFAMQVAGADRNFHLYADYKMYFNTSDSVFSWYNDSLGRVATVNGYSGDIWSRGHVEAAWVHSTGDAQIDGGIAADGALWVQGNITSVGTIQGPYIHVLGNFDADGNIVAVDTVKGAHIRSTGDGQFDGSINVGGRITAGITAGLFAGSNLGIYEASPLQVLQWVPGSSDTYSWENGDRAYFTGGRDVLNIANDGSTFLLTGSLSIVAGGQTGFKPGGGAWADSASDVRVKRDVTPYNAGLDEVSRLKPVRYRFNGLGGTPQNDETFYYGLVAQDLQPIMPECVRDGPPLPRGVTPVPDMLTTELGPLTLALVNAVQTLAARVQALETRTLH